MENSSQNGDQLTPLQKSFLVIERLQSKLDRLEKYQREPIAIVGLGCRFPGGASTPEAFWNLLQNGVDAITEVPPDRWNLDDYYDPDPETPGKMYTRYGGFIEQLQEFDAPFFEISARETISLDPQHRLLLEVAWEALEQGAQNPQQLAGTKTGVFIGICGNDYAQRLISAGPEDIDAYLASGNAHSTASGRLSYILGLTGPSLAVDTACSSSLVSVHLACSSLRNRECNLALAGGVGGLISPEYSINFSKARMLSANGRCKTFDAAADGYVRSEGCGIVVLKRLSDALADGDHIQAVVSGSATNQDGHTSGLTVPNGLSQQAVIHQALENGGIDPGSISYLEAHGTGTSLGDPIEVGAIGTVFEKTHSQQQPLIIGSVKTNIGHLEGAAGIAGLIKVVLQLQHQKIAPSLHFNQPNPYINWSDLPVQVSTQLTPWQVNGQMRRAGVSSFGFSGTNAHVILEQAPEPVNVKHQDSQNRPLHLLTLSGKTDKALAELVTRYQRHLETHRDQELADICYTANTGRANFQHRLAVLGSEPEELAAKLVEYTAGEEVGGVYSGQLTNGDSLAKVALLFTGQGSQYVNMGRQLYETQPTFRQALDQCDEILSPYLEHPLLEVLYPQEAQKSSASLLDQTAYTQPALFAIEYALFKLWESWGINPDVVMGHSVGEYVAATVAGVFSLEDGLKLIATRARLMQQLPCGGEMVSVMASESKVRDFLKTYTKKVALAAINGPESVVISGGSEDIGAIGQKLEAQGIKTKRLQVSHAFHSPLMEPMLAEFEALAHQITYHQPKVPVISNVTGVQADDTITTANYWVNHVLQPVRFAQSMETLHQLGYEIFLEIGPKPILLGMGRQSLPEQAGMWLPSLRLSVDNWQSMLSSFAQLYVAGIKVDWSEFYREYQRQKVVLPTYPFQRQRYWIETRDTYPQKQYLKPKIIHPLLGQQINIADLDGKQYFESQLSIDEPAYLTHHRVFEKPVLPATAYLEMALEAGAASLKTDSLMLEDVTIYQALIFSEDKAKTVQTVLKPLGKDTYKFEIFSVNLEPDNPVYTLHVSGKILPIKESTQPDPVNLYALQEEYTEQVNSEILYSELEEHGMGYGARFQAIKSLGKSRNKTLSLIQLSPELYLEAEKYKIHPALLDSCLHSGYGLSLEVDRANSLNIYLPIKIECIKLHRSSSSKLWSQVAISYTNTSNQEISTSEALLFDENGVVVAEITGFIGKRVTRQALLNVIQRQLLGDLQSWFYQIQWQLHEFKSDSQGSDQHQKLSHWLIFADSAGLGVALGNQLQQQGHECTLIYRGLTYKTEKPGIYQLNPAHPQDFEHLYQSILASSQLPLQKVIHLWSLDATAPEDLTISALEQSQLWGCGTILHLLQTIIKQPTSGSPQLWLVTRGAQSVASQTEKLAVAQSPLWGFSRVVSLEYPQLWGGLVDLDPQSPQDQQAQTILQIIVNNPEEDHLAQRGGQIYVSRLVKQSPTPSLPVSLSSNATYLITGGLGALGLHTAQWMVNKGAQYLVLNSRSQPSQVSQAAISSLQKQGAKVVVAHADVCNQAELTRVFQQVEASMPPLKGIVHAAGVGGYQPIEQMELSQLEAVLRPKVIGGWMLHQLTQDKELDFFVYFSSIAGVWGAAGQAHYAAANHFLDGLAHYRQAIGLPSFSVNWGPWAGGGMADEQGLRQLNKRGVEPLSPEQGLAALEQLWTSGNVQTTVAHVNWNLFKQLYEVGQRRLLLEQIDGQSQETKSPTSDQKAGILQQIEAAPESDRMSLLLAYIQSKVGKILGLKGSQLPSAEQGLFEMGMDSLMAVELRNQIQTDLRLDIPITKFMEGVTISALSIELNQQLTSMNNTQAVAPETNQEITLLTNVQDSDWVELEL